MSSKLACDFFARDSAVVAEALLGHRLIRDLAGDKLSGLITETEAYYGAEDPASRVAQQGRTNMTDIMWDQAGKLFIYMVHGYWLLNVITRGEGQPGAVLIRGLKPLTGIEIMKNKRGQDNERRLTDGPGKLTQALAIDDSFNGEKIENCQLTITSNKREVTSKRTGRIGVSDGEDLKLRFEARAISN